MAAQAFDNCRVDERLGEFEDDGNSKGGHHVLVLEGIVLGHDEVLVKVGGQAQDDDVGEGEPERAVHLGLAFAEGQEVLLP